MSSGDGSGSRLDLFLKHARLVKRRSQAQRLCAAGCVELNERTAKPGQRIQVGHRILLRRSSGSLLVRVLELPRGSVGKERAAGLYEVLERTEPASDRAWPDESLL